MIETAENEEESQAFQEKLRVFAAQLHRLTDRWRDMDYTFVDRCTLSFEVAERYASQVQALIDKTDFPREKPVAMEEL